MIINLLSSTQFTIRRNFIDTDVHNIKMCFLYFFKIISTHFLILLLRQIILIFVEISKVLLLRYFSVRQQYYYIESKLRYYTTEAQKINIVTLQGPC